MMRIELAPFVGVILGLSIGGWAFSYGWRILRHGAKLLPPTAHAALWLLRITKGEEAAVERYGELTEPSRLRLSGYSAIIVGGALIIAGLLQAVGILLTYLS